MIWDFGRDRREVAENNGGTSGSVRKEQCQRKCVDTGQDRVNERSAV